jgi:hypothetical protein
LTGFGSTGRRESPSGPLAPSAPAKKLLGLLIVLLVSGGSGAVVGAANATQSGTPMPPEPESTRYRLALESPLPFMAAGLIVQEAAPPALTKAPPAHTVVTRRIIRSRAKNAARTAAPLNAPPISAQAVVCDRLDDAKISWLLELVAKTRASHPELGGVATRVEQELRAAIGRNMCAQEAQVHLGVMCQDAAVMSFMKQMVRELPFYVRPLVGDPCNADLVAAANRWLH